MEVLSKVTSQIVVTSFRTMGESMNMLNAAAVMPSAWIMRPNVRASAGGDMQNFRKYIVHLEYHSHQAEYESPRIISKFADRCIDDSAGMEKLLFRRTSLNYNKRCGSIS